MHQQKLQELLKTKERLTTSYTIQKVAQEKYQQEKHDTTHMILFKQMDFIEKREQLYRAKKELTQALFVLSQTKSDLESKKQQETTNYNIAVRTKRS